MREGDFEPMPLPKLQPTTEEPRFRIDFSTDLPADTVLEPCDHGEGDAAPWWDPDLALPSMVVVFMTSARGRRHHSLACRWKPGKKGGFRGWVCGSECPVHKANERHAK